MKYLSRLLADPRTTCMRVINETTEHEHELRIVYETRCSSVQLIVELIVNYETAQIPFSGMKRLGDAVRSDNSTSSLWILVKFAIITSATMRNGKSDSICRPTRYEPLL